LPLSAIARARPRNPPLCAASKAHAVETEHCAGQSLLAARRLRHSLPRSGRRKRSARQPAGAAGRISHALGLRHSRRTARKSRAEPKVC
jgi:hypothetical protein